MAQRKPEREIAIARRVTKADVEKHPILEGKVGRWATVHGNYFCVADNYTEAADLASSLNRSPA